MRAAQSDRVKFLERVGFYNPTARGKEEKLRIDLERVKYWQSHGAQPSPRVANLLKSGKTDDQVIEELFLAALSRRPKTQEVEVAKRVIAKDRKTGFEDIQWALLNSTEFLVNH